MMRNTVLIITLFAAACSTTKRIASEKAISFNIDSLVPGIPVYNATKVQYKGQQTFTVQLSEPQVLSVASKHEKWGYFQFPTIERMADNNIRVRWNLNDDAMEAYGNHKFGQAKSKNGKGNWISANDDHSPITSFRFSNGERISIHTPKPIKIADLKLPAPSTGEQAEDTYSKSTYTYYRYKDLPESCQGLYFDRLAPSSTEWKLEKAGLTDANAARYSMRGQMPVIWWGDIHQAKDSSLIAGVYPGFYIDENNVAQPKHHVFFYRSTDKGKNWNIQGRIFYTADSSADKKHHVRMGYTEPAYEILADGTFICIMRTTDGIGNGPMYISRSGDMGVSWSKPEVFSPSGVLPRLLQLQNGVTVLSSGRPGVQLRFSEDGKAWTNAFEMLPYMDYKDQVSCGYTGLLATGPDRFLIVYSDFRYVTEEGTVRKAIKVREVIVTPQ